MGPKGVGIYFLERKVGSGVVFVRSAQLRLVRQTRRNIGYYLETAQLIVGVSAQSYDRQQ
ncbi:hypothetical protein FAES_3407 [Fibrella aestuarina BUZ 2]|uniref:Uncharacterized protein n=1 Tax=Fibrella aestuarina BUZ 2 TaxID=1166018 RepID=I0KBB2_9BACT|nr:hypothetical protein FAES_3407 [Fibrella aestuarina BUZ 2]